MKKLKKMVMGILGIIIVVVLITVAVINQPQFGRNPRGARLERIMKSPQWKDGQFRNVHNTPTMTGKRGMMANLWDFLFGSHPNRMPQQAIPIEKHDLKHLNPNKNLIVWFGHSSYLLQLGGKRILVDPVFYDAAPFSFASKPFKGTDIFKPADMPEIDYLVITHNHYDHLDYKTVKELMPKVKQVICTLGIGEDFEYWGYPAKKITELDWWEKASFADGLTFNSTPARHFSGRRINDRGKMLWGSFVVQHDSTNIFLGGDSGYDTHFKQIGNKFGHINLAFMENGQYNKDWKYIHTLPGQMVQECHDLGADKVFSVHNSKFSLAYHAWDEPLKNEEDMRKAGIHVIKAKIGQIVEY